VVTGGSKKFGSLNGIAALVVIIIGSQILFGLLR
jgi:hypothetical protein